MSRLYFAAPAASGNYVIYVTDGTAAGTRNIFGGTQNFGALTPYGFLPVGDDAVFAAQDPTGFFAVWVTQGTGTSTVELISGLQGAYTLSPQAFVQVDGTAMFTGATSMARRRCLRPASAAARRSCSSSTSRAPR